MRHVLLLASTFACVLTSPAFAAETSAELPTAATSPAHVEAAPTESELQAAKVERLQRAELAARMDAVIEASKKALAGLQATINVTTDPATLKDLEGRMTQVKRGTTIDLLRVQATFARENGRIEQADAIDADIDALVNPKRPAAAVTTDAARKAAVPAGGAR